MKILIVGAGPTGLTAGVELARRGIIPHIIDKRQTVSGLSRAVGIMPKSLELLRPSGVCDLLIKQGMRVNSVRAYDGANKFFDFTIAVKNERYGAGYILGLAQDKTELSLIHILQAKGGSVEYGCELIGFEQNDQGVRVKFSTGKSGDYDYLIGADGINSLVRKQAGLDYPGYDLDGKWSIADVDAKDWQNADHFSLFLLENRNVLVVVPMEADRFRLVATCPNALQNLPIPMQVTRIRREGNFNISVRQVDDYQSGRVFLAGDAAHCHSPVGGRGMNLGIWDACDLARRFVENDLDNYSQERHVIGKNIINESERARQGIQSGNLQRFALINGIKLARHVPILMDRFSQQILYGMNG